MADQYTGSAIATETPSSAPGPGVAPTIQMPVDAEGGAASLRQPWKTNSDFITYIQRCIRMSLPYAAKSGAFSAVTNNALGGTITPSGTPSPLYDKWLIQIQTGGAVGTATFKTSIDGGNTFGALQTTAASMTDATTGITLAFSGTFLANGTAAFTNAILPLAMWQDSAGNVRHLIDHNGFPVGRRSEFRENWAGLNNTVTSAGILAGAPNWYLNVNGTIGGFSTGQDTNNMGAQPASMAVFGPGTGSGNYISIGNGTVLGCYMNYQTIVAEWEAAIAATGANNQQIEMGLLSGQNFFAGGTATAAIYFHKASTDTNWQAITEYMGTATTTSTGIAPSAFTMQRFRVEYHGSATALGAAAGGAIALFFINETLAVVSTTNLPTVGSPNFPSFALAFGVKNSGALGGGQSLYVSPVFATWNRALSLPAL